jgi:thioredoxin-related protein
MRKLLLLLLIGCISSDLLLAQQPPRSASGTSASAAKTAGSASSQRSQTGSSNSGQGASQRSQGTVSRPPAERPKSPGVSSPASSPNTNAQERNNTAAPAPSYNYRTTIARPSDPTRTLRTTARATAADTKRVAALKPSELVKINWMSIEEAVERNKTEKRKIYIDVYTDWCGWCKHMDSTTFVQPAVAKYINEHYYAVKFNAEQQGDVVFNGQTYQFKRNGARGHHELAAYWLNNRLSFPTSVFLDENLNTIQPLGGYLDANKMEAILNYFGTNSHKTTPWETYERKFAAAKESGN